MLFASRIAPAALILLAGSASAQSLFHEDFESGLTNWSATGLWHVEDASTSCATTLVPFPSGTKAAWFGSASTCNYAPGASTTPHVLQQLSGVVIPALAAHPVLRFRRFLETEGCADGYDPSVVYLSTNGGVSFDAAVADCRPNDSIFASWPSILPWYTSRIPLDAYVDKTLHVAFSIRVDQPFDEGLGWWLDDIEIVNEPGVTSCTATHTACPCANAWNPAANIPGENYGGCWNSRHAEAVLYGDGVASVSNDTVVLSVADMNPTVPAILIQANGLTSTPFGDGILCVSGGLTRLFTHTGTQPVEEFPRASEVGLAVRGGIPPAGGTRHYQVVYRDAGSFCTVSTWNTSNAYRVDWQI